MASGVRLEDPKATRNYLAKKQGHFSTQRQHEDDVKFVYGMSNRPSTPIRTVVNGVYGSVAEYDINTRSKNIVSQKKLDKVAKPSRCHTRASSLAQNQVLGNTLAAAMKNNSGSNANLFKLNKFANVESRVAKNHTNNPKEINQRSRQSL